MSVVSHRRRYNGITLGPAKPSTTKTPTKGRWKHLHDPLAKRSPQPEFPVENGYRRAIRQTLIMATDDDDIPTIKEAIDLFEKNRLEDKGDLSRAQEKLEFLDLKKSLVDAIHRRRIELLDRAINDARKSCFINQLDPYPIKKAENLRDELACLDRYNHPILLLNKRTISELRRYTNPPDVIKATMAAAFLLLGECEENVEDWDYIMGLLGKIGNGSVMLKMEHFEATRVPRARAHRAESLLETVNINSVRQASFGCAAFFMWAKKAIAEVKASGKDSREHSLFETEI